MQKLQSKFPLLGCLLPVDDEPDVQLQIALESRQGELLSAGEHLLPGLSRYCGGFLHDSWVTGIARSGKALHLALNEFKTHCFCERLALVKGLKIGHDDVHMPLTLRFQNVTDVSLWHIGPDGSLEPLPWESQVGGLREWLWEEVREITKQRIALGIVFWAEERSEESSDYVLMSVVAERLEFVEGQREAFLRLFGAGFAKVFDAFWAQNMHRNFELTDQELTDWLAEAE